MIGILLALLLLMICTNAGARVLQFLLISFSVGEKFLFAPAIGFLLLAYCVLSLGLLGALTPAWIFVAISALALLGWCGYKFLFPLSVDAKQVSVDAYVWGCLSLTFVTMMAVLAGVIAPETSHDSLCYHLHVPKIFLQLRRVARIPYETNSLFPFLMEMLDTIGIAFHQIPLSKTFHALMALGSGGAIYLIGKKITTPRAALLASLLYVTTPGIVNQMGTTYVDISLAFFTVTALLAYIRFYETGRLAWAVLCGMMVGAALSVKFLALITFSILSVLMLCDGIICKRKNMVQGFVFYCIAAFMICSYWYLRSWFEWGNPVYPYFYQIFKTGYPIVYTDIGVAKNLINFLKLPWTMVMRPDLFEGYGDNIGPFYLAFLPLSGFLFLRNSIMKRIAFFSLTYLIFWFLLGQSLRFFFPALPAIAVLCAVGIGRVETFKNTFAKTGVFLTLFAILFVHTALAVYHYRNMWKVAIGLENQRDYLRRTERSYSMAEYVNANLPLNAKILNAAEVRMFYFNRTIVREDVYTDATQYADKTQTPEAVIEYLKRDGFTHFLLITKPGNDFSKFKPLRMPRIYTEAEKSLALEMAPLYTYTFSDSDNSAITYQLYQL